MELYDDGRSLTETVSWLGSVFADFGLRQSDDVLIWFTPQNTAQIGIEKDVVVDNYKNKWYGYIYNFVIFQSAGVTQRQTTGCSGVKDCESCPLSGECLWSVNWQQYRTSDGDGLCDTDTCSDIGCRREGRCQDCAATTGENACHMCFDYYCHQCSNHEQGTCSVCDGSGVSGSLSSGNCDCSNDIYGRQYSRGDSDTQKPCCAHGCASCTQEILHEYCTSCADDKY